ncbi:branched-chain amino acid ABC transporter permease [Thalassobaculum sp.]|uniref:branched-chain amino acid ABC transporter permease n=1 Tax=Thalassobaculum sp. TaxID=2022740 RepID=UPI0032EC7404
MGSSSFLTGTNAFKGILLAALLTLPLLGFSDYVLHIAISILLWAFIYTSWSVMGRFGLVSLGHGAFLGVGAYGTTMLWNHFGLTPWVGIPISILLSAVLGLLIGLPCFRFKITGHYFALVTLALTEVARLLIVALRDHTGGSLGVTPAGMVSPENPVSFYALQFASKSVWFYIIVGVWLVGLLIWRAVDRSMLRYAMEAISQEEDASASVGINVTRTKLTVTVISAAMTAFGGAVYGQYQQYINPETVSGIAISLQIVFAVIAGGMFVQLGPTVGAVITILLGEGLRLGFGNEFHGLDVTIYGLMLILFIIYMPRGVLGKAIESFTARVTPPRVQPGE